MSHYGQVDVIRKPPRGRGLWPEYWAVNRNKLDGDKMSGYCVTDDHENCPDTKKDRSICTCPCHLEDESHIIRGEG